MTVEELSNWVNEELNWLADARDRTHAIHGTRTLTDYQEGRCAALLEVARALP